MNDSDFDASRIIYLLEPEDQEMLTSLKSASENTYKKALNFAIEKAVDLSPEFNGEWVERDGLYIWRVHLISPGAYSLGVFFSEYTLENTASVFLFDPSGKHIKGSFTSENNKEYRSFAVGHIPGEEVIIELQVMDPGRKYGSIRIGSVSHAFLPVFAEKGINETGLGTSQACEIDINCSEGDDWQTIKRSVCHIYTGSLLCTGTLVNNTMYDAKPYVITAEHCINKEFRAQNSIFYFGYENSECGINDAKKDKSVSGSTLLATGDSLDFTLVKLSSALPREFNVYYAGWDARPQNHLSAISLHHPNADAMKISIENNATIEASSLPGDLNDYILESNYRIRGWDIGSTEGGSSGGPLFNSSKRLIGMLSGGLASCGDSIGFDDVTGRAIYSLTGNENDFYTKLYYDWDHYPEPNRQIKKWLDPAGLGQLSIGGLNSIALDIHDDYIRNTGLWIYPNPSEGIFSIDIPGNGGKEFKVSIYSITGTKVYEQSLPGDFPLNISLPGISKGIYLITIQNQSYKVSGRIVLK